MFSGRHASFSQITENEVSFKKQNWWSFDPSNTQLWLLLRWKFAFLPVKDYIGQRCCSFLDGIPSEETLSADQTCGCLDQVLNALQVIPAGDSSPCGENEAACSGPTEAAGLPGTSVWRWGRSISEIRAGETPPRRPGCTHRQTDYILWANHSPRPRQHKHPQDRERQPSSGPLLFLEL